MPTVLSVKGFRFFFFSADRNEPMHIHVLKGNGSGKIWLQPSLKVEEFVGFKKQEEKQIMNILKDNHETLIAKWHEYFNNIK